MPEERQLELSRLLREALGVPSDILRGADFRWERPV
jgi:hypothetical protein